VHLLFVVSEFLLQVLGSVLVTSRTSLTSSHATAVVCLVCLTPITIPPLCMNAENTWNVHLFGMHFWFFFLYMHVKNICTCFLVCCEDTALHFPSLISLFFAQRVSLRSSMSARRRPCAITSPHASTFVSLAKCHGPGE
jgi:hypothetical protein